MKKLSKLAVAAAGAAAVVVAPMSISAADAADLTFHTIDTGFKAEHRACKVLVDIEGGTAWKIYNRHNASDVTGGKTGSSLTMLHNGERTVRTWNSGLVRKGTISDRGSILMPRKPGNTLEMALYAENAGNGGPVKVGDIGPC